VTNEPTGHRIESQNRDKRTHGPLGRESKRRRTNPPATRSRLENARNDPMATGSRVENTTNEPASQEVDSRKLHKRTHGHRFESRKRDERTHRHPVESRKHDELTHRLRVKHPKTQRTNPSAIESNVESSQNRTRQVGSDASFAKRSQFRPNRMLSHELSTVFAHRVWSALALVVGSCGTGQPASERMAVCSRPSAGGYVREDRGERVMP
jgi:hypothetical protein